MELNIITSNQFQSTKWSGGTTRELYIFPLEASYLERNFQFRLSTATVDVETSDFTTLPGVSRKLMVLSGQVTVHHQDQHSIQLQMFDVDSFEGDWKTTSVGKCTDFNLMTTGKTIGQLHAVEIEKGQSNEHSSKTKCDWFFIYASTGSVAISILTKTARLNTGDLLIIRQPINQHFEIKGFENSELVFAEITVGA